MGEPIGTIRLADDSGSESAVSEILKEADYTVFVFYRGDWCPYCQSHWRGLTRLAEAFSRLGAQVVGVSSDPVSVNRRFRERYSLPFRLLSDPDHKLVSALQVKTSTSHPMAKIRKYPNGFCQPAVFVFDRSGAERFAWRQRPRMTNLFGAARRLSPEEILENVRAVVERS